MDLVAGQEKVINLDPREVVEFALVRVRVQGFHQCWISEKIWIIYFSLCFHVILRPSGLKIISVGLF